MKKRCYGLRYRFAFERGSFGRPAKARTVRPGVAVGDDANTGYADDLLLVSLIRDDEGGIASVAAFSTEAGSYPRPSREAVVKVRDFLTHLLEAHPEEFG